VEEKIPLLRCESCKHPLSTHKELSIFERMQLDQKKEQTFEVLDVISLDKYWGKELLYLNQACFLVLFSLFPSIGINLQF